MDTRELRGDVLAKAIREEVRASVEQLRSGGILPRMAAVLTDSNPAILSYAQSKSKMAADLGITLDLVTLAPGETQEKLEATIADLAKDPAVHGIILELPLASGFDLGKALDLIPPHKDVDGLTATNIGLLYMNREEEALVAATPQSCIMLAESVATLSGARVAMVGKGRTVGKPLIGMLFNRGATVTVCNSKTVDLAASIKDCDIVFAGVGKPGLLNASVIREGQIVIDAGITAVGAKLKGDVDVESVLGIAAAITPVPQGVGQVTTALIFKNLLKAIQFQK
jgi:methylenetetrahydrofolate dehydrogenase (NADP+)/methenyltetrahydrofolate cyclohydrolase